MRVDESACNQQQETVVRLITENKGLRELLEISQRSLSTPVQRAKRPTPTIHKEVTVFLRGSAKRRSRHPRALELVILLELQVQTEAVADEVEVVTLPRPGAARNAIVRSLPTSEPNIQEDDTGVDTNVRIPTAKFSHFQVAHLLI